MHVMPWGDLTDRRIMFERFADDAELLFDTPAAATLTTRYDLYDSARHVQDGRAATSRRHLSDKSPWDAQLAAEAGWPPVVEQNGPGPCRYLPAKTNLTGRHSGHRWHVPQGERQPAVASVRDGCEIPV